MNLSPRQLSSPNLARVVDDALRHSGLPASALCLEITESAIMEDPEAADATEYYADKFRTIFEEAGTGVRKAGDKAGDAADKLSDWLRQR